MAACVTSASVVRSASRGGCIGRDKALAPVASMLEMDEDVDGEVAGWTELVRTPEEVALAVVRRAAKRRHRCARAESLIRAAASREGLFTRATSSFFGLPAPLLVTSISS